MFLSKRAAVVAVSAVLGVGILTGFFVALKGGKLALANEDHSIVDEETLRDLYETVYGRPLDDGARFHIGKNLRTVLRDIKNSPERKYYAALFKSVKAYEEAVLPQKSRNTSMLLI